MNKQHPVMEMVRQAARNGFPFEDVVKNLKPELRHDIPEMKAQYERVRKYWEARK